MEFWPVIVSPLARPTEMWWVKLVLILERYKVKVDAVGGKPNSEDLWRRLSEGEREKGLGAFRPGWRPEGEQ